jgi:hypothetical protein
VSYPVGTAPLIPIAGDFNGDGKIDIAVQTFHLTGNQFTSSDLEILLNDGAGHLGAPIIRLLPALCWSLVAADVNGDGKTDVVGGSITTSEIVLLVGKGDGTFDNRSVPAPASIGGNLIAGEFTGDGTVDLAEDVRVDGALQTVVFAANGDGTFHEVSRSLASGGVGAIVDLDHDGKAEMVGLPTEGTTIAIARGAGGGRFVVPAYDPVDGSSPATAQTHPHSVAIGDVDGDGTPDLVVGNKNAGTISVLKGNGDRTFRAAVNYAVAAPGRVTLRDLNGDGRLDVITTSSRSFSVLLNQGNGAFGPAATTAISSNHIITNVDLADFNGDGVPDIALGTEDLIVGLGKGDGTFNFGAPIQLGVLAIRNEPETVLARDFDGDGNADIVFAFFFLSSGDTIAFFKGRGDGTFASPVISPSSLGTGTSIAADFNGDGILDLAGVQLSLLSIALGNGDGTFALPQTRAISAATSAPVALDADGDGLLDIALADLDADAIAVYRGNGNGTVRPPTFWRAGAVPIMAAVLEESGARPSLVVTHLESDGVAIVANESTPEPARRRAAGH